MQVAVLGVNHKSATLRFREEFAKVCQKYFGALSSTRAIHAFVLLSTCNRTEIYFSSENLSLTHQSILGILRQELGEDFQVRLYSYFGRDCFLHLCRVTSGVDSAIFAETEIQGQVKRSYELYVDSYSVPKELHYIFQKSLRVGKSVRTHFPSFPGFPSIEMTVFKLSKLYLPQSKKHNILFVGASKINSQIISLLQKKGLGAVTLCSRYSSIAKQMFSQRDVKIQGWEEIKNWKNYDFIIFGTKYPNYLICKNDLPRENIENKLVIDLSIPRNVEPCIGKYPGVNLFNMDQLNKIINKNRKLKFQETVKANAYIDDKVKKYVAIFTQKNRPYCSQMISSL